MNIIDKIIAVVSPEWAVSRCMARATLSQIEGLAGGKSGYDAGRLSRLTQGRLGSQVKEHAIPTGQIDRLRWQSWQLYRNNTYARKIVRNLESKVIGAGMLPESLASNDDGSANVQFRQRAKQLWLAIQNGFDVRGVPGQGGLTFPGLQRLALRATILSGEALYRIVPISASEQERRGLPIARTLQMIDAARLAEATGASQSAMAAGNTLYRGIELDPEGNRVAYHITSYRPGESSPDFTQVDRVTVNRIGHLFVEEDIDQLRGVPWFASALLSIRDTGDLQYNVLKSSAMAACVVLGYRKPTGANRFGLNPSTEHSATSADGTDITDSDGNAITKIQPGMFVNLGRDGELQGFSPNQPMMNAEAFVQHMLRGTAAAFPGVKGSSVTGDYRNSSFSSERSADNDTWPEIQGLQEWFATSFCQPIYEAVVRDAVMSGWFDGIVSAEEFASSPQRYLAARWQGPVCQSINPVDDINAASMAIKCGLSSPQMECAKRNINWLEVMGQAAEFYESAKATGLPQEWVNNVLGVDSQDVIANTMAKTADAKASPQANVETQDTEDAEDAQDVQDAEEVASED